MRLGTAFMHKAVASAAAAAALLGLGPHPADAATLPRLAITLSPAAADPSGDIPYVAVEVVAADMHAAAGEPLLRLPLVSSNVATIADSLGDLRVTDSRGTVPLTARDDRPSGSMYFRHWYAKRPVSGTVVIRYRAPITNALNPRGAAPPLELRTEGGGFSGAASTFLVLPETDRAYRIALTWNLSALGTGAVGLSSLGPGDVDEAAAPGPEAVRKLDAVYGSGLYFMGGRIHVYPSPLPLAGFMSAWQGTPPFDARALMRWTQSLYGSYRKFFKAAAGQPYEVFLRRNTVNAGGGVEVGRSFVGTFDERTKPDDFKLTLAHEMVHTFVESLDSPQGLLSSWYSEGLAVYYERVLPWRARLMSTADFLADLNKTAGRYYTDLLNDTPNSRIPTRFWADTRVRVLPYDRGSLYFAQLNAEVRERSHGKRSLDDLVLQMVERRRQGLPVDQAAWGSLIRQALGSPAASRSSTPCWMASSSCRLPMPSAPASSARRRRCAGTSSASTVRS